MVADKSDPLADAGLPSISAVIEDQPDIRPLAGETSRPGSHYSAATPRQTLIWLAVSGLAISLAGQLFWSKQHIQQLEQQIVATQDSFAAISGDTSLHLQKVAGQMENRLKILENRQAQAQSSLDQLHEEQASLSSRLQQASNQLDSNARQTEQLTARLNQHAEAMREGLLVVDNFQQELNKRIDNIREQLASQQKKHEENVQLQSLHEQRLASTESEIATFRQQLELLGQQLQQQESSQQTLLELQHRLQQLREKQGELEQELQAFRAQTTRSLNSLRSTPSL